MPWRSCAACTTASRGGGLVITPRTVVSTRALEHHLQPRAVQLADVDGPEQPQQDRRVLERVAQRPDPVGVADPALAAGLLDLRALGLARVTARTA